MNTRKLVMGVAAVLGFTMLICYFVSATETASATSFKKRTPKYDSVYCGYFYDSVKLKWKKVKGAKKYVVYRSKKENGKYKKFKTSKKPQIKKKASGDYYYKVRAFKGKNKSKFSKPMRVFAATARVASMEKDMISTYFTIQIENKTATPMIFSPGTSQAAGYVAKISDLDDPKAKPVSAFDASVDVDYGKALLVPAKSKRSLRLESYTYQVDSIGDDALRDGTYTYLFTTSFKANGKTLALAYTNIFKESAIAGR